MRSVDVLRDGFGRIEGLLRPVVEGASDEQLTRRVDPDANTLAWLVWHVAREQDAQVAALAGTQQVWTAVGWARRFDLPFDDAAIGYGQSSDEVARVVATPDLLVGYLHDATAASLAYVADLSDEDLDDVVDERWDPPVTRGVRLMSILGDAFEHAGQAAFLRGVLDRT